MLTLSTLVVEVGVDHPALKELDPLAAFSATVVLAAAAKPKPSDTRERMV